MDGGLDMLSVEVDFLQCHTTLMYIECMQWRVPLRYHEYTLRSLRLYSFSFVFLLPKAPSYALLCVCVCVCIIDTHRKISGMEQVRSRRSTREKST